MTWHELLNFELSASTPGQILAPRVCNLVLFISSALNTCKYPQTHIHTLNHTRFHYRHLYTYIHVHYVYLNHNHYTPRTNLHNHKPKCACSGRQKRGREREESCYSKPITYIQLRIVYAVWAGICLVQNIWGVYIPMTKFDEKYVVSQRGDSPFVYRDRGGWPASLPYICKIRVSVAIGTQSGIRLHEKGTYGQNMGVLKKWPKSDNGKVVKILKVHFHNSSSSLLLLLLLLFRFSTHVSQKPDWIEGRNFVNW